MNNDLTFFTNEPGQSLHDRFSSTLKDVQYFDVLVGYFRSSGFYLLYPDLESIEKIRILVGLTIDRPTFQVVEQVRDQGRLDFESHQQTKKVFADNVSQEIANAPDNRDTERGIQKFIEFIESGKLEIKAHPSQNIHAKVYISRFFATDRDYGRLITGSSNFSYSGLKGNYEFNVELKQGNDVRYALKKFESLWAEAVPLEEVYVETVRKNTWLNDQITPYELYLKFLYEYFEEDLNPDRGGAFYFPPGSLELAYQKQASIAAKKILQSYNGVFLADVVGLGKTFIAALLAQQLPGEKLIICPPVLQDYWRQTFLQFRVNAVVESMGKLDAIIADNPERFDYIFIDEAHRFRNESTQRYEKLHRICWGKKVILVSATPLNNRIEDIYNQLKLFQPSKRSLIPGLSNLENFFAEKRKHLRQFEKGSRELFTATQQVAQDVRDQILKYVMVRRTRQEIAAFFSDDIAKQGLSFPEVADPQRIVYEFDPQTDEVFTKTIELLKVFSYSRYTPLLYLKKGVSGFEAQTQRNIGGFMKSTLVKRLESSFHAFKRTLDRFISSYRRFIKMAHDGSIYISQHVNVYDLLDADDEEQLLQLVEEEKAQKYASRDFKPEFFDALQRDLMCLQNIRVLWQDIQQDPKLAHFIDELRANALLCQKQIIIFSEAAETGAYLYQKLQAEFPDEVLFYASNGGRYQERPLNKTLARELIQANFNPDYPEKASDVRLLITTDVLAEGINLHRANIVVNYDLPWNPTRVLQRVGRVNRVGTQHQKVYIFNFFPSAQSEKELGLEENITTKLQAFHDMLGEDAKYLTEEEEVAQFDLSGERHYRRINDRRSYIDEDQTTRSELAYLRLLEKIRDDDPVLFEKIASLPQKARAGRSLAPAKLPEVLPSARLFTFFRRGKLKKFYLSGDDSPSELTFWDAVDLLQCTPGTPRRPIPADYYALLKQNTAHFAQITSPAIREKPSGGGQSNEKNLINLLKTKEIRRHPGFSKTERAYLKAVQDALRAGIIPRNTSKRLWTAIKRILKKGQPRKVLESIRNIIPETLLTPAKSSDGDETTRQEVILCAYLLPDD